MESEEKNQIVTKLSNYLKLPKAQRWICCEWFYSDIDKVIFESENDFSLCLKHSFPRLKTRKLNRKQWCIIRSLIGKPRRCSDAFFQEERLMLEEKRQKIRLIQQRKVTEKELVDYHDLPQEIPIKLSIGHRIYAHICQPEEGVFLGTIAAVDPCEHTYRIVFDRASFGSQTVYDYNIKSVTPIVTYPIKAYIQTYRPKLNSNAGHPLLAGGHSQQGTPKSNFILTPGAQNPINLLIDDLNSINAVNNPAFAALLLQSNLDPMLGISSPFKLDNLNLSELASQCKTPLINSGIIPASNSGSLGGFPIRLLLMITRLNKILNIKRESVSKLNNMNTEAERMKANNEPYTKDFQTQYAMLILDLEKLNKDLMDYLNSVQRYCEEFAPDFKISTDEIIDKSENSDSISKIDSLKQKLADASTKLVDKYNKIDRTNENGGKLSSLSLNEKSNRRINSKRILDLITKLTALFLKLKEYVDSTNKKRKSNDPNGLMLPYYSRLINEAIAEIKGSMTSEASSNLFENKIQVHVNHIQTSLSNYNRLHAFKFDSSKNASVVNGGLFDMKKANDRVQNTLRNSVESSAYQIEDENNTEELEEDDDEDRYGNENESILGEIELEEVVVSQVTEEDEDNSGTDDSFTNNTRKFNATDSSDLLTSTKKQKFNKQQQPGGKLSASKGLNTNLNGFKTVLYSTSSTHS